MIKIFGRTVAGLVLLMGASVLSKSVVAQQAPGPIVVAQKAAGTVVQRGSFRGRDGHKTSGTVEVVTKNGKSKIVFKGNFSLDSAPAPWVGFGKGGYRQGTIFSRLKSKRGGQTYAVPGRLTSKGFTQVWIWCKKFNSPIGVANLSRVGAG